MNKINAEAVLFKFRLGSNWENNCAQSQLKFEIVSCDHYVLPEYDFT